MHDSQEPAITGRPWFIVPDGDIKLIFPFRGDIECTIGGATRLHRTSRIIVSAMRTAPGHLAFPQGVGAIGVILQPEAAYRLLGVPMHELRNRTFEGVELLGRDCRQWQDRMMDAMSVEDRVGRMQIGLRELLGRRKDCDPIVEHAVVRIRRSNGRLRIDDLARETGWSRRHLDRMFQARVGVSPKGLASICRFNAVYRLLRNASAKEIASVIYDHYYDQAHFLKDFRRYSGFTPRAYLQASDYGRFYIPA